MCHAVGEVVYDSGSTLDRARAEGSVGGDLAELIQIWRGQRERRR